MVKGYMQGATVCKQAYELTATSQFLPFLQHKGILIIKGGSVSVLHNSPTLKNSLGGSVVSEPLSEWLRNRNMIDIEKIEIANLEAVLLPLVDKRYDLFNNNCEHFTSELSSRPKRSPQLIFWLVIMIVILAK